MSEDRRRLGNRYSVERSVGHGGMAQVYEGTDTVLGRTVAIKVLAPQYARDEAFVARFRREAQAAASLNHPGVVSVYDTGSDDGVHFIVMEYVAGRTLAQVLEQEGRLQPERAAEVAHSVAQALSFAHAAGIIHRDVKPANIMLGSHGGVKVMDFGIARALSSQTLTQTATVLGTASYLSPEQAQGDALDARSDVYSLGVVLYEMLTGQPPFSGDTPVAVAYKHVRENPPLPSALAPEVPQDLEAIVMKAMAKNRANRYSSAQEMADDLERFLHGEPVTATPLLPASDTMVIHHTDQRTAVLQPTLPEEEERRGAKPLGWILLALLILAALGLALYFLAHTLVGGTSTVKVPNVVGQPFQSAELTLQQQNLVPVTRFVASSKPKDQVIRQDPKAGNEVDENSKVKLTVSGGPLSVTVPDITGKTPQEAARILKGAKLRLGSKVAEEPNDTVPQGSIVRQIPKAGDSVSAQSSVNFILSTGPQQVPVPNVVCLTVSDAKAAIQSKGLVPRSGGTASQPNLNCPQGNKVAATTPDAGTLVDPGSEVTYFRSSPTPPPTTPSPPPTMPSPPST
jgi:beta-lactam-binding protein with PASTA domain/tRNA A-37 threonylcarbamoyl transferase component Bud32